MRLGEDVHYYSVPYQYIGKKVKILYTSTSVEVYHRYTIIADHTRSKVRYHYTTNTDHLASQHRFITDWTPEKFLSEAMSIHEDVARYISKVLENKPYPEQAYKSCNGILSFARRVGADRLIEACRWAESMGQYSYIMIEDILKKRLDQIPLEDESAQLPSHDNIRGKEYYQ